MAAIDSYKPQLYINICIFTWAVIKLIKVFMNNYLIWIFLLADDQYESLLYLSFIVWSLTQIVFILVLYKQPSLSKGLASKSITWSSEDKSNSFKGLISAKALLPIYRRLFGKTSLSDWRSSHFLNASFPISSIPLLKLMSMISLLERNVLRELP